MIPILPYHRFRHIGGVLVLQALSPGVLGLQASALGVLGLGSTPHAQRAYSRSLIQGKAGRSQRRVGERTKLRLPSRIIGRQELPVLVQPVVRIDDSYFNVEELGRKHFRALQRMRIDLRWLVLRFDWFSCAEHLKQSGQIRGELNLSGTAHADEAGILFYGFKFKSRRITQQKTVLPTSVSVRVTHSEETFYAMLHCWRPAIYVTVGIVILSLHRKVENYRGINLSTHRRGSNSNHHIIGKSDKMRLMSFSAYSPVRVIPLSEGRSCDPSHFAHKESSIQEPRTQLPLTTVGEL
uniref:(California timema) hypothetical protein n=1 Tax=Timema californicum TaxID=61474 RepID=A0A7R9J5Z9_TIMCA|nr:unnamed protein product [Timema californicum]